MAFASPINPVDVAMQEYATRALRLIALVGGVGGVIISALVVMTISWVGLRRLRLIFLGVRVVRSFRQDD